MKHKSKCQCDACNDPEGVLMNYDEAVKKYGFAIHHVFGDTSCPNNTNAHTHGIMESFGHPDFQLCFNIHPDTVTDIFHNLVDAIRKGEKFEVGKLYDGYFIGGYKAKFIWATQGDRKVLRLLIPDVDHSYTGEMYAAQLTMLNDNPELN